MTNIETAAQTIATDMIETARASTEPVVFVTGNAYMPPLRSYDAAETVWQNDADGIAWELLTDALETLLLDARVHLTSPDYDNALCVVDLARWQPREEVNDLDYMPTTLSDEWEAISR